MIQTRVKARARDNSELVTRFVPYFASYSQALRCPPTLEQARFGLARRRQERAAVFLSEVRQQVFTRPDQPYARLLGAAGCSYGDLERLVRTEGLEGALVALLRQGVYLTEPELKGRRPVVRGSLTFPVRFRDLRRIGQFVTGPDGRRQTRYGAMFREVAEDALLSLEALGGLTWRHGYWGNLGDTALLWFVRYTGAGCRPARWFTRIDPGAPRTEISARLLARYLQPLAGLAGVTLPALTYVPLTRPDAIVEWLRSELTAGKTPQFCGAVSLAMAVSERAEQLGVDLRGAHLGAGSEPLTEPRHQFLAGRWARIVPNYFSKETGPIAYGCTRPEGVDDLHFYDDYHAIVQRAADQVIDDHPAAALYLTSLRPSWPYLLINASVADRGEVSTSRCGCPLEALGWRTRLQAVRSFGRLKLAQLTIADDLLITLLEQCLPAWFGGRAGSYQLVEEQLQIDGQRRLRLLVDAAISAEPAQIRQRLLDAMAELGAPLHQLSNDQRWLVVERGSPLLTEGGKIYPIRHLGQASSQPAPV
jgi:hypothetical protein